MQLHSLLFRQKYKPPAPLSLLPCPISVDKRWNGSGFQSLHESKDDLRELLSFLWNKINKFEIVLFSNTGNFIKNHFDLQI